MAFVDLKDVTWSKKVVAGKYPVLVPSFMDVHLWWSNWEKERFASMEAKLKPGMTFYDIGAYDGWQDAIISHFVGGSENMILVEPEPTNWGNIKATFDANGLDAPYSTYMGFIGTDTTGKDLVYYDSYPSGPDYSKLISHTTFRHLDENAHNTSCLPLDALVGLSRKPDAINVDVEGAALIVLRSAVETLRAFHPTLWVSIHGQMTRETYNQLPSEQGVHEFLAQFGYKGTLLANDHEEEWIFE